MQEAEDLRIRQHLNTFGPWLINIFQQNRQRGDVIDVLMGDEDVLHQLLAVEFCKQPDRAGVDRHGVVDQIADQKLPITSGLARRQQFNPHGRSLSFSSTSFGLPASHTIPKNSRMAVIRSGELSRSSLCSTPAIASSRSSKRCCTSLLKRSTNSGCSCRIF